MKPMGTTGTGKTSDAPITAPLGNYELTRYDRVALGWDMTIGRTGRMTVSWLGDVKPAGQAQPLSAGVFRLPATDYAARSATTSTATASLQLDRDPLGSQFLNDSADAGEQSLGERKRQVSYGRNSQENRLLLVVPARLDEAVRFLLRIEVPLRIGDLHLRQVW
jgi:hypothetical protein